MTQDAPFIVRQGPGWLAELLYQPPGWVLGVVILAIFAVGLILVDRIMQQGVEREQALMMFQNVLVIVFCGGVTKLLTERASYPYIVDVGVGVAVGFVAAVGVRLLADRTLPEELPSPVDN